MKIEIKHGKDENGVGYYYAPLDETGKLIKIVYDDGRCVIAIGKGKDDDSTSMKKGQEGKPTCSDGLG